MVLEQLVQLPDRTVPSNKSPLNDATAMHMGLTALQLADQVKRHAVTIGRFDQSANRARQVGSWAKLKLVRAAGARANYRRNSRFVLLVCQKAIYLITHERSCRVPFYFSYDSQCLWQMVVVLGVATWASG